MHYLQIDENKKIQNPKNLQFKKTKSKTTLNVKNQIIKSGLYVL